MGLDTVSGLLRIVVNGVELVNMEKEYFKNSATWKPKSLEGHILQFKAYLSGFWIQHRNTFSNMNIFSSMMSVEDMVTRTAGEEGCDSPGNYLRSSQPLVSEPHSSVPLFSIQLGADAVEHFREYSNGRH